MLYLVIRCCLEKDREGFLKIVTCLLDAVALACDVELRAPRHVAIAFTFNDG